jgi:hypothetical protein
MGRGFSPDRLEGANDRAPRPGIHAAQEEGSMSFLLQRFGPNAMDVVRTGQVPSDLSLLRAEFLCDHRVSGRLSLANLLPKGGVGAELGVFTGLFSATLLDVARPREMHFVDPWWKEFGQTYPDWGLYTDKGKLGTQAAHDIAARRINGHANGTAIKIEIGYSTEFLLSQPDRYFDWVYLDSTHSYDGTRSELDILKAKVKAGGVVSGDDWHDREDHPHFGVAKAVRESLTRGDYEFVGTFPALQWAIRVPGALVH